MNEQQKNKIAELLDLLALDCASQINSLESSRKDVSWDCYDIDNWRNSLDAILDIAKLLDIEIEDRTNNEDNEE